MWFLVHPDSYREGGPTNQKPSVNRLTAFFIMSSCYILFSKKLEKYYVGATKVHVEERLLQHKEAYYGRHKFTAKADDWELYLEIECSTISQALRIESHIKCMKSTQYIQNLRKYPEMIEKLLHRFHENK